MRILLLLGCLLASEPALAGPFDVSPTLLEVQVNKANATLGGSPLPNTQPQDCGDVGTQWLICNKTVSSFTISAWGHESPPSIDHVVVLFWNKDPPTVKVGVWLALTIYDPAFLADDLAKAQPVWDALSRASDVPVNLNGVNATYIIKLVKDKSTLTIDPHK